MCEIQTIVTNLEATIRIKNRLSALKMMVEDKSKCRKIQKTAKNKNCRMTEDQTHQL